LAEAEEKFTSSLVEFDSKLLAKDEEICLLQADIKRFSTDRESKTIEVEGKEK